ncbi:endothelin-converting enzyme [Aminobacter aminovorans]|uniref:Neutral endopeptidase n=2 Tax=Aminobacter aminovorans TaxID=83263 RepID=A0A380WR11_AMIAI|nr:endothelin-converting enzyme [Aminobacter aminovorans]SUU91298.1 Neutral endopeptidase [Aminobacter aminovorans]
MRSMRLRAAATFFLAALVAGSARAEDAAGLPALDADKLVFSISNMDPGVKPGIDFYRYASGAWLDRVDRPARLSSYGVFDVMAERLRAQMSLAVAKAGEEAANAPKGIPVQQVGSLYNAYMDTAKLDAAGIEPIRGELDRVAAIKSFDDLVQVMARQIYVNGPILFAAFATLNDPADTTRNAFYAVGGGFGIEAGFDSILAAAPDDPRRAAYRKYVASVMQIAGYPDEEAARIADLTLTVETELYAAKLSPAEGADPRNRFTKATFDELQPQIPELDLKAYFRSVGYEVPQSVVMYEPRYLPVLSKLLRERPLGEIKDYIAFRIVRSFSPVLTTAFDAPELALQEALTGVGVQQPRQERLLKLLQDNLGHPVSQIYVQSFFPEENKQKALDMVERILTAFRERIPSRAWLSDATRAAALEKVNKFYYRVGYPEHWIDYSRVEIGPDLVADMINIGAFGQKREIEKQGKPTVHEEFNSSSATLPIVINAGYTPSINGFEVTAAILQAPAFLPDMDAAVYFCRIGGIIGHEMVHGFDSGGRQYDAQGNFRDWWAPSDAKAFEAEAQKLIDQANAFEVLPGLHANGPLNVRENMADVGGITLAYAALMDYLKEHPGENVKVDGLTPAQRCFISWAQMWTWKATDQYQRAIVAGDGHPPNNYRAVAPLQHLDAFYQAFDIKQGDPMWLPPEKRVKAW